MKNLLEPCFSIVSASDNKQLTSASNLTRVQSKKFMYKLIYKQYSIFKFYAQKSNMTLNITCYILPNIYNNAVSYFFIIKKIHILYTVG